MTSISFSSQTMQRMSPLTMLQKTLATEVAAGKINAADQDALSAALDTIDSAMKSARQSGERPSPEGGKAKVESMIDDMVTKGSLTAEQASELKSVFEDTFAGGPGGPRMGPPPPPPEDAETDSDNASDAVSLTFTGSAEEISTLLKQLLEGLASGGSSTYSSSAKAKTNCSSLFLDKTA